jgi:phosphatidylglycerol:prolipoprotein diacylglycerol transferase
MHPVICHLGPVTVYSYGVALVAAFFVCVGLASAQARKIKIDPAKIYNILFVVFISGIIGARLFYLLTNLAFYLKNPLEMIMLQHGGLAWFGGLAAGSAAGVLMIKIEKLPLLKTLDLVAPFAALGQSIGRLGCFFNGCCFGDADLLIPVQIISSLLLLLMFIVLRRMQELPHRNGEIFFTYTLLYSLKRFGIEFLRRDNPHLIAGLSLFHILSIALFLASLVALAALRKNKS